MARIGKAHLEVLSELHANAAGHAEASNGFFTIDPFDPENIDPSLLMYARRGDSSKRGVYERLTVDLLVNTGGVVDKRFKTLKQDPSPASRTNMALDNMADQLRLGQEQGTGTNIGLAMKHGETIDVAFNLAAVSMGLTERNVPHRTALVLNKGMDFLRIDTEIFGYPREITDAFLQGINIVAREDGTVPLRDFVGLAADYVYFVTPNSATFSGLRARHGTFINRFNAASMKLHDKDLEATGTTVNGKTVPGMVIGFAAAATTEKLLDIPTYLEGREVGNFDTYPANPSLEGYEKIKVIGKIGTGIVRHTKHGVTFVSGLVLDDEQSQLDINPRVLVVTEKEDTRKVGAALTETQAELDPGTLFIQDNGGNLPTKRQPKKEMPSST